MFFPLRSHCRLDMNQSVPMALLQACTQSDPLRKCTAMKGRLIFSLISKCARFAHSWFHTTCFWMGRSSACTASV